MGVERRMKSHLEGKRIFSTLLYNVNNPADPPSRQALTPLQGFLLPPIAYF